MGEYTDIQGQIARIETTYAALHNYSHPSVRTSVHVGSAAGEVPPERGFFARIDEITEYRPTLAGALAALELRLANEIDDQIGDLNRLRDLRATLAVPK